MEPDDFVRRWENSTGTELSNFQSFMKELCAVLELPEPDPANDTPEHNEYVFERHVTFRHPDGSTSHGRIDLYRRGCFVCEGKQTNKGTDTASWDNAMTRAHGQAQQYARALPAEEGRPPFIMLVDVGRSIELHSEFTRSGASYVPYPDPRSYRISLAALRNETVRNMLRAVWLDPLSLDPARRSAQVTREIAIRLASLAKSLESKGQLPDSVAAFLMRCLFSMFAEDVGLLPNRAFTTLLEETRQDTTLFTRLVPGLWQSMNRGGFSAEIRADVLRFNGGLFSDPSVLPLDKEQIDQLIEAAKADWRHVEPAIFGTLLERALDPTERHRLGAHYTPRAYVERLVMPTVIEPLREDWTTAQATALQLEREGKRDKAIAALQAFHNKLCHVRVLDPACGSGNFLYVTLEHLKRLEGEVLNTLGELGHTQGKLEMAGVTVDPHQMLGMETNPRAARIAEAVLWIGYLQWHFKTRGDVNPPEPVLKDFHNIECRDAVLTWDSVDYVTDEQGRPVTRWDGRTFKKHPATGEDVPDENSQVPMEWYVNPGKADWPKADFVVGNPPFVGEKRMREALGDGYVDALRNTYPDLPACDLVMYWWHKAALLAHEGEITRFGFITTNSITQTKNRHIVEPHLSRGLALVFAVPNHPWVDAADGAAVRIAMTVAQAKVQTGKLLTVTEERESGEDAHEVRFNVTDGIIHANLRVGPELVHAGSLAANRNLVFQGVKLVGNGFIVRPDQRSKWIAENNQWQRFLPQLVAGSDLTKSREPRFCIDFFGLMENEAMTAFPPGYQKVVTDVKPFRDNNNDKFFRENWWVFGRGRGEMRDAIKNIKRYIVTSEVSKHRAFLFLDTNDTLADGSLAVVASDDGYIMGVLSSRIHIVWALSQGGRLGIGNDPRWQNGPCFENFPFPGASEAQMARIRAIAEQIDVHRKRQQATHPGLTLTGMYNVLEKLRRGKSLTAKEKTIHEHGLVSVLAQLHNELDATVFEAYGWSDLAFMLVGKPGGSTPLPDKTEAQAAAEEELLTRLVTLNTERAAEEARGVVRWLRPELQNPGGEQAAQGKIAVVAADEIAAGKVKKHPWPKALSEQVQALRRVLAEQPAPAGAEQLARQFSRAQTRRVLDLLQTLVALGQAREVDGSRFAPP